MQLFIFPFYLFLPFFFFIYSVVMATSVNHKDNKLHSLVVGGQLNQVQKLISNGCDPNSPHTTTGLRPIHFAASRGHANLVEFLSQLTNVDIDAMDKEGEASEE